MPEAKELDEHGWSEVGISGFVRRFVDRVMKAGGGIAMGSHPSFMNAMRDVAILHQRRDGLTRWKIWVGKRFIPDAAERAEYEDKYGPYAEITWVGELDPPGIHSPKELAEFRQAVLTPLRDQFIEVSGALVCVGGRPTRKDSEGNVIARAGVEEEAEIAWDHRHPLYFVGAGGGVAAAVYDTYYKTELGPKTNGLSRETNALIATRKNPAFSVFASSRGSGK